MISRYNRRRRQRKIFLGNFYLNSSVQYITTVVSAIALAGFVFSGFLLFRFTDEEDLINQGRMQLMEGKVAWAAKTFQTLVTNHNDSYQGHLLLGQAYLQLDERRKAEEHFQKAASLKGKEDGGKTGDHAPEIALGKVAMAQGDFPRAEKILYNAWKRDRQDESTKQALFELYEQWGNTLTQNESKDYGSIVQKYKVALRFAGDYQSQQSLEDKLTEAIHNYVEHLVNNHDYPGAIQNLKISLQFKYLPETLAEIAEMYARLNRMDDAIAWYRKGFEVSPSMVGLRLSNVLVQRGQQLIAAHKPEEARKYLDEADQISRDAKIPMVSLYPVNVSHVKIEPNLDTATGEFNPTVDLKVSNDSTRDLSYLAVKAEFLSNDHSLANGLTQVATIKDPLLRKNSGSSKSSNTVSLKPDSSLNVHALKGGKMTIRISIAYQDGDAAVWQLKSIQETTIKMPTPVDNEEDNGDSAKPV